MSYDSGVSDYHCDPIGDLREYHAAIYLERNLTPFERVAVRAGLSNGSEFPRRIPVRFRALDPDAPDPRWGHIRDQDDS